MAHNYKVNFRFLFFLLVGFSSSLAVADDSVTKNSTTGSMSFEYDIFFQSNIKANVSLPIGWGWSITPYAKIWNRSPVWTETGVGITYSVPNIFVSNFSVGSTNGLFLTRSVIDSTSLDLRSAAVANTKASLLFAEGVVVSAHFKNVIDILEYDVYMAYYIGLRNNPGTEGKNNLFHYSAALGLKPIEFVAFGLHYESLIIADTDNSSTEFMWLGPYVNFMVSKVFALVVAGGVDLQSQSTNDFYKISAHINF